MIKNEQFKLDLLKKLKKMAKKIVSENIEAIFFNELVELERFCINFEKE